MFSLFTQARPAYSQAAAREIDSLIVGQRVPDEFWTKEHLFYLNGDTVRKSLNEFRDKTIILDFWATWCGSCLKAFPEMIEFSTKHRSELNIIPVTGQKSEKVIHFLNTKGKIYSDSFPFILHDSVLESFFPHRFLPHVIIISNQRFIANSILDYKEIAKFLNKSSDPLFERAMYKGNDVGHLNGRSL